MLLRTPMEACVSEREGRGREGVARGGRGAREGDGPFVMGDTFSMAEAATAPFVQRLMRVLPGVRPALDPSRWLAEDKLTNVDRWVAAVCARPSCVDTLPPEEELQEGFQRLLERFAAAPAR